MSLKQFKPITQPLELISPKDGSPLGIFINVVGPDSKEVRDMDRAIQKERITKANSGDVIEIEDMEMALKRKFAAAVVGWDAKYDEELEGAYSVSHVEKLFEEYAWLADQVATYVSHRQNFFR